MNWLVLLLTGSWDLGQAADDEESKEAAESVSDQDDGCDRYVPIDSTMVDPTEWE